MTQGKTIESVCMYMNVCVVCVRERDRKREKERGRESIEKEEESVCVFMVRQMLLG